MKLDDAITTVRRYVDRQETIMRDELKDPAVRAKARASRLKVLRDCGCVAAGRFSK